MTARDNYDSNAISTGLSVGEIFSQLEVQMISNRKAIFEKAAIADNFKASVYLQLESFMEANKKAAAKALSEAVEISSTVIKKSYEKGISTVDKAMDNFKQQGYKPPQEPSGNAKMIGLVGIATAVIGVYKSIAAYSQDKAKGQLLSIASLVNNDAEDLYSEIDRVQAIYLKKGIAGAEDKAGNEKSMSAQAEYTLRNESQQALITAEGERNAEYGHHLVIVTAHPSCCPLCLPWQQQILVDDVFSGGLPDGKHELLSTALAAGLGHYNCRHNWVTFVEGLDKHDIFKREQASPKETALRYAVEQEQRYNERMIREWKRREAGAMTEQGRRQAEYKVKEWQAQQRHLGKIADEKGVPFYRQYDREQIGGETKPTVKTEVKSFWSELTKDQESGTIRETIDILTPCLVDAKTGEVVETTFEEVSIDKKQKGWLFDWSKENKNEFKIEALKVEGSDRIEGLIAWKPERNSVYVKLVEAAPHNRVLDRAYSGVGGHLFAEAVKKSYDLGNYGHVYFEAKTKLIDHYQDTLGATLVHNNIMEIKEEAAVKLYEKYYGKQI